MKGIILAGGFGSRLYPLTLVVSKQLMPVYNKPMIYYPLSVLLMAGVKDILIISTPYDLHLYKRLFQDGLQIGCNFSYAEQPEPKGLAQAFTIGDEFIGSDSVALILGDNIFYGTDLQRKISENVNFDGAIIFAYQVADPERYGVVEFDKDRNVLSIEEKPKNPKTNYAVPGLYFYNNQVVEIAKNLKPSSRGEYEITDINKEYIKLKKIKVMVLGRGTAWLDTGTHESLLEAGQFVEVIEKRQGLKIGCIEEIAYRMKFINRTQFIDLCEKYNNSNYGIYLKKIIKDI